MSIQQDELLETVNGILQSVNSASPEVIEQTLAYGRSVHEFGIQAGACLIAVAIIAWIIAGVRREKDDGIAILTVITGVLCTIFGPMTLCVNYWELAKITQSPILYVIQQLN